MHHIKMVYGILHDICLCGEDGMKKKGKWKCIIVSSASRAVRDKCNDQIHKREQGLRDKVRQKFGLNKKPKGAKIQEQEHDSALLSQSQGSKSDRYLHSRSNNESWTTNSTYPFFSRAVPSYRQ